LLDLLVDAPAGEANAATSQHQSVGAIFPGDGLRDDRGSAGVGRPGRVWVEVGAEATR
jgi:hypothetical protein